MYGRAGSASLRRVNYKMPLTEGIASNCRILLVENSDDMRAGLARELETLGHEVSLTGQRRDGLAAEEHAAFDLLISDLVSANGRSDPVRSFKVAITNLPCQCTAPVLYDLIKTTLAFKIRCIDRTGDVSHLHEKIDLELPSDLRLMSAVLDYLLDRVGRLGLVQVEQSNLFVALDEAFVNAVKHGNRNDPDKLLRVTADLSAHEAIFTVEDEGEGFDVREIPDPTDADNLFKATGRGVLLIYNIMDEVEYSKSGKHLRMVKRSEPPAVAGG